MIKEPEEFSQLLKRVKTEFSAMSDDEIAALIDKATREEISNKEVRMSTSLAAKPASVLRTYTQQVRDHTAAMQRLQDQYFAALKRAEAQYFDGVKRITDALTQEQPTSAEASVEAPVQGSPN